ncbi:threonine synthase [Rhodospirillaceae bacterium KN72]|uniref:Threonine synthase n=1 Tax=Pacificispira spongiicola TaxID=2729598 RepID=A0A7Y0HDE1_9PROT|nr:threonine synthase [Pacificispira spongiicola]NMM43716.1 threonine synthase [Pacificispira spongiicola]
MRYISTRGEAPDLGFADVLLTGLARDGGLYVPADWPRFTADEWRAMRGLPYDELATRVCLPFLGDSIDEDAFADMASEAYAGFDHDAVAPLKQLNADSWLMELFHGPTLSFKDYALQLVGRMFDHVLKQRGERICIVGATSGDTGSAAIEACRDRDSIDIFILHPFERCSEVQRRQMTTVAAMNVHNVAVDGTFDDCQDLVKAMFNDAAFRDTMNLSAVNSINWARIMCQIVYYVHAALSLGAPDREVSFAVPTGNFGNVFAGYAARQMGLPIQQLIVGSNENDILARFLQDNDMSVHGVVPTHSPSMDIQVSSNFERLLFELMDRDGPATAHLMQTFRASGKLEIDDDRWHRALQLFSGHRLSNEETLAAMKAVLESTGELVDPHSAIGIVAGWTRRTETDVPLVVAATAHPAKFPDAVEAATGIRPALPPFLSDLYDREERYIRLPNSLNAIQDHVRTASNRAGGV